MQSLQDLDPGTLPSLQKQPVLVLKYRLSSAIRDPEDLGGTDPLKTLLLPIPYPVHILIQSSIINSVDFPTRRSKRIQ